jgi:hypothetical protein
MYHKLTMLLAKLRDRLRERFDALMESVDPLIQAGRNLRQALDHRESMQTTQDSPISTSPNTGASN